MTSSIRRWGYSSYGLHGHQWFQPDHFEIFFFNLYGIYPFKPCRHIHISWKLIVYSTVDLYPHYWDFTRRCCSSENSTSCALCECWAHSGYIVDCTKTTSEKIRECLKSRNFLSGHAPRHPYCHDFSTAHTVLVLPTTSMSPYGAEACFVETIWCTSTHCSVMSLYHVPLHWPLQEGSSQYCPVSHPWTTLRCKHCRQFWKHSSTLGLEVRLERDHTVVDHHVWWRWQPCPKKHPAYKVKTMESTIAEPHPCAFSEC